MHQAKWIWEIERTLPSDPYLAVDLIAEIVEKLQESDWSDRDRFHIHLSIEEAVMNAIKHGNQKQAHKMFDVVVKVSESDFYIRVTDQGDGFDPDCIPDPTCDENLEKTSGRGVMLMQNLMDSVEFNACGNSVEMRKSRSLCDS